MPLTSKISSIIANQLGRLQGSIEAQVQTEATNLLSKFANQCPTKEEDEKELNDLLNQIRPLGLSDIEREESEEYTYRASNGKDYNLVIIEDNSIESVIPRRLAVAKDNIGVIVLRGQPSFSSTSFQ